jgi:hypothetical protein
MYQPELTHERAERGAAQRYQHTTGDNHGIHAENRTLPLVRYPSCLGRRMADTAVHLERYVLPAVPIRHWICSLPWGLRALCGYDRKLCAEIVSAFVEELSRSLRFRAKHALGLKSVADAHTTSGSFRATRRSAAK